MIKAQSYATESILEYILRFCEGDADSIMAKFQNKEPLPLKNMQFKLERSEQDDQGVVETKDYLLQVPLITMFPIPYMGITSADLNLNFKVVDVTKKEEQDEKTDTKNKTIFKTNIIQTRYTSAKIGQTESTSDISIKIHLGQTEAPLGLSKFLTGASNAVVQKDKG